MADSTPTEPERRAGERSASTDEATALVSTVLHSHWGETFPPDECDCCAEEVMWALDGIDFGRPVSERRLLDAIGDTDELRWHRWHCEATGSGDDLRELLVRIADAADAARGEAPTEARPETCPTCGSDDPKDRRVMWHDEPQPPVRCSARWHSTEARDEETPKTEVRKYRFLR